MMNDTIMTEEKDGVFKNKLDSYVLDNSHGVEDDSIDEEALPSSEQEHEQLPSPAEYKAKLRDDGGVGRVSSSSAESKSRKMLLAVLGVTLFVIIITAIAVSLAINGTNNQDLTESQLNTGFVIDNDGMLTKYYDNNDDSAHSSMETSATNTPPVSSPSTLVPAESSPTRTPVRSPTLAPVMSQLETNVDRMGQTISYLVSSGAAKQNDLDDNESPQGKAASWIAIDDQYQMDIPSPETDAIRTRFIERWTLAVLYYSSGGPAWNYNLNFLQPIDHCDWSELFIDDTGSFITMGVTQCVEQGAGYGDRIGDEMVSRINLSKNGLAGRLPDEMQNLRKLENLTAPFNPNLIDNASFDGLMSLTSLKHVELQYCGITGTIPDDVGRLVSLTFLGLGNNVLTGAIPDGLFQLTNLNVLGLDDNALEGDINAFEKLTNIEKLYIEDNLIFGAITDAMVEQGWKNMIDLDVSGNKLTSSLPSNLWSSMPNLEVVDVHNNELVGAIPEIKAVHEKVRFVAVQSNAMDRGIPDSINKLINLAHLDVSSNTMDLSLPSSINQLSNLRSLYIGGNNNLNEQPIPAVLEGMTNLRELSMKQSKLIGTIPRFLGRMTNLKVLDLDSNKLDGSIPSELGRLTNINTLMLNRNELTGTIPASFASLDTIDLLLLDGNHLSGTADAICSTASARAPTFFATDCGGTPEELEIDCACCTLCCTDTEPSCNNLDWNINLDGIYEYDFQRVAYKFSQNILAEEQP